MRLRDFQVDINKNFNRNLKKMAEIFNDVSVSLQSPRARALFTSALEFVKPHHLALGLRVSRLNVTRIELVVPDRRKNLIAAEMDPGILVTAAGMGAQLLLRRMDQPDLGVVELKEAHLNRLTRLQGELRGRLEFPKISQETFRAELKKNKMATLELLMIFYDAFEKRVADCQLIYHCGAVSPLEWKDRYERPQ